MEEDNERLLREFLAAEEKARLQEAERMAAQIAYAGFAFFFCFFFLFVCTAGEKEGGGKT